MFTIKTRIVVRSNSISPDTLYMQILNLPHSEKNRLRKSGMGVAEDLKIIVFLHIFMFYENWVSLA
jgi:hypothetical protein